MEYRFSESEEPSITLNSIEPSIYPVYLMSEEEKKAEESTPGAEGEDEDKEMEEPVEEKTDDETPDAPDEAAKPE